MVQLCLQRKMMKKIPDKHGEKQNSLYRNASSDINVHKI